MKIHGKRVLNIGKYLHALSDNSMFRIICDATDAGDTALKKAGFSIPASHGDTILPRSVGPVSGFNADGRWEILRDEPMESRYIRTVRWHWKQWCGRGEYEEMEDDRDIFRDCYPRDFIEPPSLELTYIEKDERRLIVAGPFKKATEKHEEIKHAVNLFLELFGECDLVNLDLAPFIPEPKRVNWRMLPPGEYPWPHIQNHLKAVLRRSSAGVQGIILDRQKTLSDLNPDETYIGQGGFSDYVAYVFKKRGIVILESIRKDNAIYVFGKNWLAFSRLTKAEVLNNGFHIERIVHMKGWKDKLMALFQKRAAA